MYYQQSSAKVFWIAFITSLVVSGIVSFTFIQLAPKMGISGNTEMVSVPDVDNLELQKAEMILNEKELKTIVEDEIFSTTIKKGRVIDQKPIAGQTVNKGTSVRVILSKGPETVNSEGKEVIVPSVIGFDINQAKVRIAEKNLNVGTIDREESEKPKDVVLNTIPEPGTKVNEGMSVRLIVSSGGGLVTVPNLRGKSEYSARSLLRQRGLEMGLRRTTTSAEHAFDIIIYQDPSPGSTVERGSEVNVTINREG